MRKDKQITLTELFQRLEADKNKVKKVLELPNSFIIEIDNKDKVKGGKEKHGDK